MIRTKRQHPRLGPASEWSWQATSFTVSMIATLSLLAIGMPALAQHKHAISEQFVDGAPAVANEVIVKLRTNAGANAVAELPAPSSVFSWQNGNLLRSNPAGVPIPFLPVDNRARIPNSFDGCVRPLLGTLAPGGSRAPTSKVLAVIRPSFHG